MRRSLRNTITTIVIIMSIMLMYVSPVSAYGPLTMYTPPADAPSYAVLSPRTIQLTYSGENNGKMYTTFEECSNGKPRFPIFESTDEGLTWVKAGDVEDTVNGWGMMNCPQLFEMPQTIGSLTKGTLICIGNSCPSDKSKTRMDMYKSTDLGRTWTFASNVAAGGANSMNTHSAIWEPFMIVANNKLICYISDERDPNHNQKLVHYTTNDGVNWGDLVEDVVWSDRATRPGMPVVAKLSNGNYIMVYEVVGQPGLPNNFKITSDPENWRSDDKGTTFSYGGSPYVTVLNDGRIAANSYGSSQILVNTKDDGTGMWIGMETPIREAYNRCLLPLYNNRLFIVSGGGFVAPNHNSITYADMEIPPTTTGTIYTLKNVKSGTVIAISQASQANGANAIIWPSQESNEQKWMKVDLGGGYSKLFNLNSGKALGVWQGSTAGGANVVQWSDNGSDDQQWIVEQVDSDNNYFSIINRKSGLALCTNGGAAADGTKLIQWPYSGGDDQKWQLVPDKPVTEAELKHQMKMK